MCKKNRIINTSLAQKSFFRTFFFSKFSTTLPLDKYEINWNSPSAEKKRNELKQKPSSKKWNLKFSIKIFEIATPKDKISAEHCFAICFELTPYQEVDKRSK